MSISEVLPNKQIEATGNSLCGFFKGWLPLRLIIVVLPRSDRENAAVER